MGNLFAVVAFALLSGWLVSAEAQTVQIASSAELTSSAAIPLDIDSYTIRKHVEEVQVAFTAEDSRGHSVPSLAPEQLRVFDGDIPVLPTAFRRSEDLPLTIAVLLDHSLSVDEQFESQRDAVESFLRRVLRPDRDRAAVALFDVSARGFSKLSGLVEELMPDLKPGHRRPLTSIYDSLVVATERLELSAAEGWRTVVLITDGNDTNSHHSLPESIAAAQRAGAAVYSIALARSRACRIDVLEEIAQQTGGRVYEARNVREIERALMSIERDLRTQFAVSFRPAVPLANKGFRPIRIVSSDSTLLIRTRAGYYAGAH